MTRPLRSPCGTARRCAGTRSRVSCARRTAGISSTFLMVFLHASSKCFAPATSLGFLCMAEMSLRERICNTLCCAPVTFHVFHRFFLYPDRLQSRYAAQRREPDVLHASDGVNSSQKSECASDRSIREAREKITHKFCGYACGHLRHKHATRRSASVFCVRPKNSLPRIALREDDSALDPAGALASCSRIRERAYSRM